MRYMQGRAGGFTMTFKYISHIYQKPTWMLQLENAPMVHAGVTKEFDGTWSASVYTKTTNSYIGTSFTDAKQAFAYVRKAAFEALTTLADWHRNEATHLDILAGMVATPNDIFYCKGCGGVLMEDEFEVCELCKSWREDEDFS